MFYMVEKKHSSGNWLLKIFDPFRTFKGFSQTVQPEILSSATATVTKVKGCVSPLREDCKHHCSTIYKYLPPSSFSSFCRNLCRHCVCTPQMLPLSKAKHPHWITAAAPLQEKTDIFLRCSFLGEMPYIKQLNSVSSENMEWKSNPLHIHTSFYAIK